MLTLTLTVTLLEAALADARLDSGCDVLSLKEMIDKVFTRLEFRLGLGLGLGLGLRLGRAFTEGND